MDIIGQAEVREAHVARGERNVIDLKAPQSEQKPTQFGLKKNSNNCPVILLLACKATN